jgi:hypothetical protein
MGGVGGERYRILDPPSRIASAGQFHSGLQIGQSLARLRREVIDAGGILCDVLEPSGAGLVTDAMRVLEHQVCRIAVIGQIKAGKSSFINALVQQPDLLPTDVNPWTTAVTNLHFGSRDAADESVIFHFFAASEWEQLAEGGGRLRELTERLVPGFEPDLLRRHLSALKTRAATRLGPEFANLLGRHHRFATLSPDVLRQYVCQGDLAGMAAADHPVGRYSDITKSADIYLAPGPFDYPTTVTDTPGTNDPFLVRDEITRRCLESADLYIVVLAARQALTAADVALLRILRGLHKERIIVFLNRIDELSDIVKDTELVLASVRRRLHNEFPGADIALIAGSARWANCAVADAAGFAHVPGSRALSYLQHKGHLQREQIVRQQQRGGDAMSALRPALFAGSGLGEVYQALNELLGASHDAYVLRQMTACFAEMVRASESTTRQELESLSHSHADTLAATEHTQSELSRLRGELTRLNDVSSVIDKSAALFKERQMEIVSRELSGLRHHLLGAVNQCALIERDALVQELQVVRSVRTWTFDTQAVRRQLAEEFIDGFRRAEAQLLELQQDVVPHLRRLLALLVPDADAMIKSDILHRPVPPPRMMSLGASVALDLDESWWSLLWKARPAPLQRGRELERLIRTEFGRVVDELVDACERSLADHVVATTEWTFGICDSIARSISRRREDLVSYFENLQQEIDGAADPQTMAEQQRYIAAFEERLDRCEELSHTLERIGRDIARDLPSAEG